MRPGHVLHPCVQVVGLVLGCLLTRLPLFWLLLLVGHLPWFLQATARIPGFRSEGWGRKLAFEAPQRLVGDSEANPLRVAFQTA